MELNRLTWNLISATALILGLILSPIQSSAAPQPQDTFVDERATVLLDQLTPKERVGQLFLVTFNGSTIDPDTDIYKLIANSHIGGVILRAENDNFSDKEDVLTDALEITQALQRAEWETSRRDQVEPVEGTSFTPAFIPLFIGISQGGNGYPNDQILSS